MFDTLTDDNFILFCIKNYHTPNCIMSEFENDLKRTKYIKRLIRKYKTSKSLKERLILNHLVMLYNVFGPEATAKILFFRLEERDYDVLKTFLIYLNILPNTVINIKNKIIHIDNIPIDMTVANTLRAL